MDLGALFCGFVGRALGNLVTCLQISDCAVVLGPEMGEAYSDIGYELSVFLTLFQFGILFMISCPCSLDVSVHIAAKGFMAGYSCFD